jgi:hypothetical protein
MIRRLVAAATFVLAPRAALACPVCFGSSDSPLANATNLGIMALLGFVAAVLSGFALFIVHLNRRARLIDIQQHDADAAAVRPPLTTSTPQEGSAQC